MSLTLDELWIQIRNRLSECEPEQRQQWTKVLIRRLRHPEVGAEPQSTPEFLVHRRQGGGAMPKFDSPLCQCGDPRSSHDEDGACKACHCPMYANEDSIY